MFYYAQVDSEYKVIAVTQSDTAIVADNYVEITEEQYISGNLVNEYYNRLTGAFETVFEAMGDTTLVQDGTTQRRLSTKLDNMQVEINGKAEAEHTHDEYAEANHTHNYAATAHTHAQSDVTGLETTLSGKANTSHTHAQNEVTGLSTALDGKANTNHGHSYNELTDKPTIPSAYTHPETHPATMITGLSDVATSGSYEDLTDKPTIPNAYTHPETHSADMITGLSNVATSGSYEDLSDKPTIPEAYTHPATHPASMITGLPTALPANGGNADTVDGKHASDFAAATHAHSDYATVEEMEAVETAVSGKANANHTHSNYAAVSHTHAQSEITGLATALNGKANTSHTHSEYAATGHNHNTAYAGINHNHDTEYADISHGHTAAEITETTDKKVMTAAERTKLSGIATGANNYTHPSTHAASMITGLATVATSGSYNDLSNKPTSMTPTAHTHGQSEVTGLETALAGKASTSHTHNYAATNHNHDNAYISKNLQMTADNGDISISWSGKDVVAQFKALASGMHTAYSPAGATNNPNTLEGFRFMCHKTGSVNYGWVMAYGTSGSVYTGYLNGGTWQGWKALWEYAPTPLWSGGANGGYYMTQTHTVTPTKKLSECRNGWALLWSDYDVGGQANNTDFYMSYIYKRAYTGQVWGGGEWYCDIPSYSAGTATDSEQRVIKLLQIYDAKIVGTANNAAAPRNDVVLRAVYEF